VQDLAKSIPFVLLRTLLDGAVDADKIDYLQRDASHVGVQFGHGVDIDRLERRVTAVLWRDHASTHCSVAAWTGGQAAAEGVIATRHSMFSQVYAHRTVRAARAMLNYVAWRWREARTSSRAKEPDLLHDLFEYSSLLSPSGTMNLLPEDTFVSADDNLPFMEARTIRWMARQTDDDVVRRMAEDLIQRRLYKPFAECDLDTRGAFSDLKLSDLLALVDYLSRKATESLTNAAKGAISAAIVQPEGVVARMPAVLFEVAVPKTMKRQKELVIARDELASRISGRRLLELASERTHPRSAILGVSIETSEVYKLFGGSGSRSIAGRSTVRAFARPDLAPAIRSHFGNGDLGGWLDTRGLLK
jgi:hypothetical protein